MSTQVSNADLREMADRFRNWSRTPEGVRACDGTANGSFVAENDLVAGFIAAVADLTIVED